MIVPWIPMFEEKPPHILTEKEIKEIEHVYISDLKLWVLRKNRKPKRMRKAK